MKKNNSVIAPGEIRAIRERLGLTQVEAGELLGSGPRAFTKYEAGSVKPAASVITLLRLLEAEPSMLATLQGRRSRPMTATEGSLTGAPPSGGGSLSSYNPARSP